MSFPSGSTLKVFLLNGASPNTGPFDLYVNSVSAGNLIADNVLKTTLSSSGYEFVTPVDTLAVVAKSDGTITTEDTVILGNMPNQNKLIYVTGSYDSSLTAGQNLAVVYLDSGYGFQTVQAIPSALNTCPGTTVIGSASIEAQYNTLVAVKNHETGSNLIKFSANNNAADYFHWIPSLLIKTSGIYNGVGPNTEKICVDLNAGNYQTTAQSGVEMYPTSSLFVTMSYGGTSTNTWNIIKVNGNTVLSSSLASSWFLPVPPNSIVEVSSSVLKPTIDSSTYVSKLTGSYSLTYKSDYENALISQSMTYAAITPDFPTSGFNYKFSALPGAIQTIQTISYMEGRIPSDLTIDYAGSQVARIDASYPDAASVVVYFSYIDTTLTTRTSSATINAGETSVLRPLTHPEQPLMDGGSIYITSITVNSVNYPTPPVEGTNVMWSWLD